MKRPPLFTVVVAWSSLVLLVQFASLNRPSRDYLEAGERVPGELTLFSLFALGFVIWQTVGLVRLRRFHRWFAVCLLSLWSATLVWNATSVFRRATVDLLPAVLLLSTLVSFNLLSIYYLSRRSFRAFAVQFVAERDNERHSRIMQKVAQKRMQHEIQSWKR